MAQSNLDQTEDRSVKDSVEAAVETDWSAVAAEMPATPDTGPLGIRELQNRVASAHSGSESAPNSDFETGMGSVFTPWPARRQLAFFLGAGALCWVLILAPILL